jgi:hypothetical protein
MAAWLALIRRHRAAGRRMERVHLIEALTPYLRYEISWGYDLTSAAGEDIRIVRSLGACSSARAVPILKDFWLFDETTCVLMDYDALGRLVGCGTVPDEAISTYLRLKGEVLAAAVPLASFRVD